MASGRHRPIKTPSAWKESSASDAGGQDGRDTRLGPSPTASGRGAETSMASAAVGPPRLTFSPRRSTLCASSERKTVAFDTASRVDRLVDPVHDPSERSRDHLRLDERPNVHRPRVGVPAAVSPRRAGQSLSARPDRRFRLGERAVVMWIRNPMVADAVTFHRAMPALGHRHVAPAIRSLSGPFKAEVGRVVTAVCARFPARFHDSMVLPRRRWRKRPKPARSMP